MEFVSRDACPGCASPEHTVLAAMPFDRPPLTDLLIDAYGDRLPLDELSHVRYELYRCSDCGLIYQRHVADDETSRWFYEQVVGVSSDETRHRTVARRLLYSEQIADFLTFRRSPSPPNVLDFGCGHGVWLDVAAALGCTTTATDIGSGLLAAVGSRGHRTTPPDQIDRSAFDLINAEQVLEHVTRPGEVMELLAGALRPGGVLRVGVPDGSRVVASLRSGAWLVPKTDKRSLNPVAPLEHVNCFDHGSLRRLGTKAGLATFRYPLRSRLGPDRTVRSIVRSALAPLRTGTGLTMMFRGPSDDSP